MQKKGIGEGFRGQKILEVPNSVIAVCQQNPLISRLFITRMGVYPKAHNHYFQRPAGISQTILIYCTDGKGRITIKNKKFDIAANDVFLIPAHTPHSYGADADNPWSIYWIHLAGENTEAATKAIMPEDLNSPVKSVYSEDRIILFDKMFDCIFNGYLADNLLFANLSLNYFLASFILPGKFSYSPDKALATSPTEKAMNYIRENLQNEILLDNIAHIAGLSVSFFSRKFKADTGYSPIEYLNYLRVQKACQLLHFTNIRVNELAFLSGFNDPFYFSRFFKKQMGISPLQYRKKDGYLINN